MNKRPLSVTLISALLIITGVVGLAYHFTELRRPFQYHALWVCLLRLLAIVAGVFMLRGSDWARWLTLLWLTFHVVLSAFHTVSETVVHGLLLAVIAYCLFRPEAKEYFRPARAQTA